MRQLTLSLIDEDLNRALLGEPSNLVAPVIFPRYALHLSKAELDSLRTTIVAPQWRDMERTAELYASLQHGRLVGIYRTIALYCDED